MTTRSTTLVLEAAEYAAGDVHVLATVPEGEVWILKDITITNIGGATSFVSSGVRRAGVYGLMALHPALVSLGQAIFAGRFIVALAGDDITLVAVTATSLSVLISGAALLADG